MSGIRHPTRRRWWFICAVFVLLILSVLAKVADSVTENDRVALIDTDVLRYTLTHRSPTLSAVARAVTALGSVYVVVPVTALSCALFIFKRHYRATLFMIASTIGTSILVSAMRHLVGRARPPAADHVVTAAGAAFPSGHAAQGIACYAALAFAVTADRSARHKLIAWVGALLLALVIGLSRIYLGVHWLSDVVSGWLVAAGWLGFLIAVWRAWMPTRRDPLTDTTRSLDSF